MLAFIFRKQGLVDSLKVLDRVFEQCRIGDFTGESPPQFLALALKLPAPEKWLKVGASQMRLDLRYLTQRWQKAVEDVLVRVRDQQGAAGGQG